jgi:uroporphyrin-III C-methyltransferase/precorrin-2 dehydrogenase/sirohydrochlorin ferrochelatase
MGIGAASHIEARLLDAGIDPLTPVTVVENGTLPQQKVAIGWAGSLVETIIDRGIKGPAVIFVGAHPVRPAAEATGYPTQRADFPLELLEAA